jgi:hypothetical protein
MMRKSKRQIVEKRLSTVRKLIGGCCCGGVWIRLGRRMAPGMHFLELFDADFGVNGGDVEFFMPKKADASFRFQPNRAQTKCVSPFHAWL